MKHFVAIATLALAACAPAPQAQPAPPPTPPMTLQLSSADCGVRIDKYLEMGFAQFDQRPEGWREIAAKPGCETAAAELVRKYR
jgi:hypothetical protein